MTNHLNKGHSLYTDNYFTNVDLPSKLIEKKTHLVGTLRTNRKHYPKKLNEVTLQKGQLHYLMNANKVCVRKWKDKKEILFLSTKHQSTFIQIWKKNGSKIMKLKAIHDYNKYKTFVDLFDQLKSYSTSV